MASAKDLIVKPISASDANRIIKSLHYSGRVVQNSQLHLGVFLNGKCGGAMQFGPSLDKRKIQPLVAGTLWNEFIELNRMAFADWLPRNGESRCIGYAMRWLRKTYPQLKWVISFADGMQCGDGTIYRASGFVLLQMKRSNQFLRLTDGTLAIKKTLDDFKNMGSDGRHGYSVARKNGAQFLPGFQLKYIYFLDPSARQRLTVPILPFSRIAKMGAGMYRGKPRAGSADSGTPDLQSGRGGATPTSALPTVPHGPEHTIEPG
jgi:hypothetical protein